MITELFSEDKITNLLVFWHNRKLLRFWKLNLQVSTADISVSCLRLKFLLPEHCSSPGKCYLRGGGTLKLLNCNFKSCVWLWQHGFFPALEKSGLDPTSSDFIYYGKTWDGKKYLFTQVKIFCHLIWETVYHLNFITQCSSLSFFRGER